MPTLTEQCLPPIGVFSVAGILSTYQILTGSTYEAEPNFYRPRGSEGHVLHLRGGPEAALRLVERARTDNLALPARRSVPVGKGRMAGVEGHYLLVEILFGADCWRRAIIFVTQDGYLHQHYETNLLDNTAIARSFQNLSERRFVAITEEFLKSFLPEPVHV